MKNIDCDHAVLPGQKVDRDLGDRSAVGKVIERSTRYRDRVPVNFWGAIETSGRELHSVEVRFHDKVRKRNLAWSYLDVAGMKRNFCFRYAIVTGRKCR